MQESIEHALAKVQNSLKKEKVIETLTEARMKILNQEICQNFDDILAKRKLYMYLVSYYQDFYLPNNNIDPIFFSTLFSDEKTLHPTNISTERSILLSVKQFKDNIPLLAKNANLLLGIRPNLANELTYSTIPSIFGLLTEYKQQKLFLKFIEELKNTSNTQTIADETKAESYILFARSIFLIPEFRMFIQSIADQITVQFKNIQGTSSAVSFLSQFLTYAEKFIHLCPPIFGKLANKIYSLKILEESFFRELIKNPLTFGFVQIGELENITEATEILLTETGKRQNFIENLKKIFIQARKNDKENAYSKVSSNIHIYHHIYYFTSYDVQLIRTLASIANIGEKSFPDDFPLEYELNIYQDLVLHSDSERSVLPLNEDKDVILKSAENSLRSLLINADPMPMIPNSNLSVFLELNLIDHVSSQFSQAQHVQFEILKNCKKRYQQHHGNKITFEEFVKLLIPNIKSQKKVTTLNSSNKLQTYTTSLTQMQYSKKRILEFLTEKKFEISHVAISLCFNSLKIAANDKAFLSKSGLMNHFTTFKKAWENYAKSVGFSFEVPNEMLLVSMLKLYKYDNMKLLDKYLAKWDKLYNQYTSDDYDTNQDNKELDNLFKNERERFKPAVDLISRAFEVESTLLAMKLVSASFNCLKKLLNEVIGNYGMDEFTPAIFYLVYIARPKCFISKTEYFFRVFQTIDEFKIPEYREYVTNTFYLHQTAVYFFHNSNPNPLENDRFMKT